LDAGELRLWSGLFVYQRRLRVHPVESIRVYDLWRVDEYRLVLVVWALMRFACDKLKPVKPTGSFAL
jgi:hypothetical protein